MGKVMPSRWVGYHKIVKECATCAKKFNVPPARKDTAKYCSRLCADTGNRSAERRVIECAQCKALFETIQDHGVWPKFCSKKCFGANAIHPAGKECAACGNVFMAERSTHPTEDGRRIYCSKKCAGDGRLNGDWDDCAHCGKSFYKTQGRTHARCCSRECASAFYVGAASHTWKGGEYVDQTLGDVRVRCMPDKPGGSAYRGKHRLVAARAMGRMPERHEPILHLNRNKKDNRPENLYICTSMSLMQRILMGSIPWPKGSNLSTYR